MYETPKIGVMLLREEMDKPEKEEEEEEEEYRKRLIEVSESSDQTRPQVR